MIISGYKDMDGYMYAKIESQRLFYLRTNQKKLRTDVYQGIQDFLNFGNFIIII